jgi:hypothetical protein
MGRRVERGFLYGPRVVAARRQVNDARIRRALPGRAAVVPRRRIGEEDVEDAGKRVFLVTFAAKQAKLDALIPQNKYLLFRYGDKIQFSNRPDR